MLIPDFQASPLEKTCPDATPSSKETETTESDDSQEKGQSVSAVALLRSYPGLKLLSCNSFVSGLTSNHYAEENKA